MSLDKRLLDILCCPTSRQPLQLLQAAQRERINAEITHHGLPRGDGERARQRIDAGLITRDGSTVYRIDDGIPVLLSDEAIDVRGLHDLPC